MFLKKMKKEVPEYKNQIKSGNYKPIKTWLIENIYMYGNLYDPEDLVKKVTGSNLKIEPFINYLDAKFKKLYRY
jgi:carboxypeptidase Taq